MDILFVLLPFVLFLVSSYYFNVKKIDEEKSYIILISFVESVISYLIVLGLFLNLYLPGLFLWILSILTIAILSIVIAKLRKESEDYWDWRIETIKNNILLFVKILLPFYAFMTIFRYLNVFIQLSLSIVITVAILYLFKYIRKALTKPVEKFFEQMKYAERWIIGIYLVFTLLLIYSILFVIPTKSLEQSLNLSNDVGYFEIVGNERDMELANNFKQEVLLELEIKEDISGYFTDYFLDSDYLYLQTSTDTLYIIDLKDNSIIKNQNLSNYNVDLIDTDLFDSTYTHDFVYYDGQLLLFSKSGVYLIEDLVATKIAPYSFYTSSPFLDESQELYLIDKKSSTDYDIYKFNGTSFDFIRSDFSEVYYVHSFELYKRDGSSRIAMYDYSFNDDKRIEFNKKELNSGDIRLYIDNQETDETSFFNHVDIQEFTFFSSMSSYVCNYDRVDGNYQFLQIGTNGNSDKNIIKLIQLNEQTVDLKLPFYTHYGLFVFVPILIGCCFNITNYYGKEFTIDINSEAFNKDTKKDK